ncbi:MAG: hypothetical protein JWR80_6010 [Bradyrhizobium sp.]|nr:hypothetical protein [Bradyrhizobium sp.]
MPTPRFIALERLALVEPATVPAGTLLIQKRGGGARCRLVAGNIANHSPIWHVDLADGGDFELQPTATNEELWLAIPSWRLVVDPDSVTSPFNDMPKNGDAFISAGVPGLVGRFQQGRAYIALAGGTLPEPSWPTGYAGFRRWRIVSDDFEGPDAAVLIEHGNAPS